MTPKELFENAAYYADTIRKVDRETAIDLLGKIMDAARLAGEIESSPFAR